MASGPGDKERWIWQLLRRYNEEDVEQRDVAVGGGPSDKLPGSNQAGDGPKAPKGGGGSEELKGFHTLRLELARGEAQQKSAGSCST